jgi:hypothetical protein
MSCIDKKAQKGSVPLLQRRAFVCNLFERAVEGVGAGAIAFPGARDDASDVRAVAIVVYENRGLGAS